MIKFRNWITKGGVITAIFALIVGLLGGKFMGSSSAANTAQPTASTATSSQDAYPAPGQLDTYYAFLSGGQSGDVYVYGIPSMRELKTIPVFTPDPRYGYGFTPRTKAMLGGLTWGDVHHPRMSETNGQYNGKWLFVQDKANNRVAEISLKTFSTTQILNLPNQMGTHSLTISPNSHYLFTGSEFSTPLGTKPQQDNYAPLSTYKKDYYGYMSAIKIGSNGTMSNDYQMIVPPYDYDLAIAGHGMSSGWVFLSCYNTEEANHDLEVNSTLNSRDYVLAINYRAVQKLVDSGKYDFVQNGEKMIDPRKHPGIAYFMPAGKNPHGVNVSPSGQYICASGKLDPIVTVFDYKKMIKAIQSKDFQGTAWNGIPVLTYKDVMDAEVPVGLGPLHTEFDNNGYAYTSLFVGSEVTKWQLGTWKVIQQIPVAYNVGHVTVAGGDTTHPYGHWLLALDKMSQNRFLPVGPSYPMNEQLFDISGPTMKLVREVPANREPHYSIIAPASIIHPISVYPLGKTGNPNAITSESQARIVRNGNHVTVYMAAVRSHYTPDEIKVKQGDLVTIYLTNIEQQPNITHGFAITDYNINVGADPGQTREIQFTADKAGVFPYYCTDFCSALHEEMMGYLLVSPK